MSERVVYLQNRWPQYAIGGRCAGAQRSMRMWLEVQSRVARRMDGMAARRSLERGSPQHLVTGERGELEALFYLRKMGYTVVARRWKTVRVRGDVDLIGWDGEWLCFVEVKTRSRQDWADAVSAVDDEKRQMLRRMARAYMRSFPERLRTEIPVRFDVASVYLLPSGVGCELYRGAFGW
jgi:putative endonuclease